MENDVYSLNELIKKLEDIKYGFSHSLNFAKAFYCLAIEIIELKKRLGVDNKSQNE